MVTLRRLARHAWKVVVGLCGMMVVCLLFTRTQFEYAAEVRTLSRLSILDSSLVAQPGFNGDKSDLRPGQQKKSGTGTGVTRSKSGPILADPAAVNRSLFEAQILGNYRSTVPPVNPHDFKFTILEDSVCSGRHSDLFILSIVHTAPKNYQRRMLIRETWGNLALYDMVRTRVVFAMGATTDPKAQNSLMLESEKYHDIIQENFLDSYRNLTYKAIMWLKWSGTYCPNAQYVVKVDDDIFVNIFNLAKHLSELHKRSLARLKSILCLVWNGMPVMRDKKSKWYIPKEDYHNDYFSTYCSGSAYILSMDIVFPMFQNSFKHKFFWVDDFYATGLLPKGLGVTYHNLGSLYVLKPAEMEQRLVNGYALFGHVGSTRTRYKLWRSILKLKNIKI